MKKILCASLFLSLFIVGCSEKDYTLTFKKEMVIDYKSGDSTCALIDKIGDTKIDKKKIKDDKIKIDNFEVKCGEIDSSKIGTYTVSFLTNESEDRKTLKQVVVKDISAPKITLKKKSLSLYVDEVDSFDPFEKEFISITDNSDKEPIIKIEGDVLKAEKGTYKVKIVAIDKNENTSSKTLTIKVKEREKKKEEEEKPKENINQIPNDTPPKIPSNTQNGNGTVNTPVPPIISSSLPIKRFMFADGYTMPNGGNSAFDACVTYKGNANGGCYPLTNAEGIYIGVEYRP